MTTERTLFDSLRRGMVQMEALGNIFRRGLFTSEFVVAVLALVLPTLDTLMDGAVAGNGGPEAFTGGLIAAVYVFVRGWIKARGAGAALTETGNKVSPGLGSATAEAEYRRAHT